MQACGLLVLMAGFLIHFTIGISLTFGNLLPYLVSYSRLYSGPSELRYTDAAYVFSALLVGWGMSAVLGGLLEREFGPKYVNIAGGTLMSLGSFTSYFAIKYNYWMLLLTYGVTFGLGCGMSYMCPITCIVKWYPNHKGVVSGFISGGLAFSGTIVPFIQTFYVNPKDYEPDEVPYPECPDETYFTQPELLERVPDLFLIIGGICAGLQLLGSIFLQDPLPMQSEIGMNTFVTSVRHSPQSLQCSQHHNNTVDSIMIEKKKIKEHLSESGNKEPVTTQSSSRKLLDMLSNPMFYALYFIFTASSITRSFITALYKAYGLEEVSNNDLIMMIILVIASIVNMLGRTVWGCLADKTSYKFAFVLLSAMMSILVSTLYATSAVHWVMYLIWISGINFGIGGYFAIFPVAVAEVFGSRDVGLVYGIIYTGQVFGGIIAALLSQVLVNWIDWYGTFFALAGIEIVSFLLVLLFPYFERHNVCLPINFTKSTLDFTNADEYTF